MACAIHVSGSSADSIHLGRPLLSNTVQLCCLGLVAQLTNRRHHICLHGLLCTDKNPCCSFGLVYSMVVGFLLGLGCVCGLPPLSARLVCCALLGQASWVRASAVQPGLDRCYNTVSFQYETRTGWHDCNTAQTAAMHYATSIFSHAPVRAQTDPQNQNPAGCDCHFVCGTAVVFPQGVPVTLRLITLLITFSCRPARLFI